MFAIYQVINRVNGKSYIGFTIKSPEQRWGRHRYLALCGSMTYFHCAIRKYGAPMFVLEKLEEGWDPKIGKNVREPYWISVLKPEYNHTAGGEGTLGYRHTDSWKQDKSNMMIGKQIALGAKYTRPVKEKYEISVRMRGNQNPKGIKRSEKWCKRQSIRMLGNQYGKKEM